jgi:hypothetical protein
MPWRFPLAVQVLRTLWSILSSIFGKKKEKKMRKSKNRKPRSKPMALHREYIYRCCGNSIRNFTLTAVDVTLECYMSSIRVAEFLFTHLFLQSKFLGKEVRMIR